jgi:hypothetical protein
MERVERSEGEVAYQVELLEKGSEEEPLRIGLMKRLPRLRIN